MRPRAGRRSDTDTTAPNRTREMPPWACSQRTSRPSTTCSVHQLRDIHYAEKRIVNALPEMIDKASNRELRVAFERHFDQTRNHVKRVEEVFRLHGAQPEAVNCPTIDGIIEEAEDVSGEVEDKQVLDAALIAAAQAVEHYEMARYGTLIAWANRLGRSDYARLFKENLAEEKAADQKLTMVANASVNRGAA
jgi:ferritin-like metal-binding protein YciE